MALKDDSELSDSPVVANCRMNRERQLTGGNSYARDLGFSPVEFLQERLQESSKVRWLDLCCGQGRALIEAATEMTDEGERIEIFGIDLAGLFLPHDLPNLQLIVSSIESWDPAGEFDLITCVHGLHYVGDKLAAIRRAASRLSTGGRFAGHLDAKNLRHADHSDFGRVAVRHLREAGLTFDSRRHLIGCEGPAECEPAWRYLGADDQAGPNFTDQPAVDSWYADIV